MNWLFLGILPRLISTITYCAFCVLRAVSSNRAQRYHCILSVIRSAAPSRGNNDFLSCTFISLFFPHRSSLVLFPALCSLSPSALDSLSPVLFYVMSLCSIRLCFTALTLPLFASSFISSLPFNNFALCLQTASHACYFSCITINTGVFTKKK